MVFFSNFAVDNSHAILVKQLCIILSVVLLLCSSCGLKLKPATGETDKVTQVKVERYDRLQSRYLTTGDFSALQQMSTSYPMETRTLIEDILKLGQVNDPEINTKLLNFYQDSTLQALISDAEAQYANMDDINKELSSAFHNLRQWLPNLKIPMVYAQISALDQSIIVSDGAVGISLDKYLGEDYPLYAKYYNEEQRATMTREYILPDCLCFYLISQYPLKGFDSCSQIQRDYHFGKIQWVVNKGLGHSFFKGEFINTIEKYMHLHKDVSIEELLEDNDYKKFM